MFEKKTVKWVHGQHHFHVSVSKERSKWSVTFLDFGWIFSSTKFFSAKSRNSSHLAEKTTGRGHRDGDPEKTVVKKRNFIPKVRERKGNDYTQPDIKIGFCQSNKGYHKSKASWNAFIWFRFAVVAKTCRYLKICLVEKEGNCYSRSLETLPIIMLYISAEFYCSTLRVRKNRTVAETHLASPTKNRCIYLSRFLTNIAFIASPIWLPERQKVPVRWKKSCTFSDIPWLELPVEE